MSAPPGTGSAPPGRDGAWQEWHLDWLARRLGAETGDAPGGGLGGARCSSN